MASTSLPAAPSSKEFTLPQRYLSDRRSPARWIVGHVARYWYIVIVVLVGAFGNAALAAVVPVYTGEAFNEILSAAPSLSALGTIAWIIAISQIIRAVLQLGRNFGAELIGQYMERDIRDELYISLLGKSMTFHSLQPVGDTMARATNDVREINLMFSPGFNLVIGSANFLLMPLIFAPRYYPSLVLVPALFVIGYFFALWQYLRELSPITSAVRSAFGTLNSGLAETLDGIETVKGSAQEEAEVKRFQKNALRFRDNFVWQGNVEARFLPLLLLALAEAGSLLHAMLLFNQGLLQVGDVIAYFGLIQLFGFPTFVSLFAYSQVSSGMAGARRILELIKQETDLDQNKAGYAAPLRGEIEFRDVCFRYETGEPVLEKISFAVAPGQTVAIVGQTGSGKTSLAKLINRTYDVNDGQVLIDGQDVRQWNLESLRSQVSVIEQDIFLFSRSIAENIAFGKRDATRDEIVAAAKAAQADEFILSFSEGYDAVVGERGVTLSGGQRQRLALARAFLTNPGILILDDSTSSIDSATEDRIQQAIYAAAKGRTTLIITHRLSQIRWANLILVLRQGQLEAAGSHEQLMASSAAYRKIFIDERESKASSSPTPSGEG
jgi:ATP-binding cassette, subfamily B, bacterial